MGEGSIRSSNANIISRGWALRKGALGYLRGRDGEMITCKGEVIMGFPGSYFGKRTRHLNRTHIVYPPLIFVSASSR